MNKSSIDPGSLVGSAEVDGRVYTDQGVFNLEMEKIFGATWVYVGHESQLSEPGAYIATDIGAKPVILVKDSANRLRAFHNRCPHKGSRLVNNAAGKIDRFLCNFHNYSFNLDGSVAAIPLEDAYENSGFGACEKVARMVSVPHVESYRGFIFAALKQPPMDLRSWLSDTRASIDNLVDRSPEGRLEVVGRPFKWINHCNWKMLVENLVDGMHVGGTHPSIGQTATKFSNDLKKTTSRPRNWWKWPAHSGNRQNGYVILAVPYLPMATVTTVGKSASIRNMTRYPVIPKLWKKPTVKNELKISCRCNVITPASIPTCM